MNYKLPDSWITTTVGEVYQVIGGGTPATGNPDYWNGDVPWITSADIEGVRQFSVRKYVSEKGIAESTTNKVPTKTLLVVTRVGLGKIAITETPVCFSQDLQGLIQKPDFIYPEFALYILSYQLQFLKYEGQGTTISGVTKKQLKDLAFPLPPLPEQHRIVAKIEELFFELDKGIENLKTAQAQLKVYRQALLKHAFEGKLTAHWRKENQDKLESADALLKRIQQERKSPSIPLLQRGKTTSAAAVPPFAKGGLGGISGGRRDLKPKAPKPLPPLTAEELAELPELPEGWVKVGNVGLVGTGITPLKGRSDFYANGNIPWVTSGALNDNFVTEASDYVTDLALKETNLRIYPKHTLLIALYGEGKTRGKCSELLIEATTNQAIAAIVQEGISEKLRKFMKWFFQKNYGDIRLKSSGGVQPNLNLSIIENTLFPMCSIEEAIQVVDAIETKLSEVDQLELTLTTSLQQAEALRQSILKKAFSGQLVPQDPHDEPASALLARIRAERAGIGDNAASPRKAKKVSA